MICAWFILNIILKRIYSGKRRHVFVIVRSYTYIILRHRPKMIVLIITYVLNKVSICRFLGNFPGMIAWLQILGLIEVLTHLWTTFSYLLWLKRLIEIVHWIEELYLIAGLIQVYKLDSWLLNVIRWKLSCGNGANIMDFLNVIYSNILRNSEWVWSCPLTIKMLRQFYIILPLVSYDVWIFVILILVFYLRVGDLNVLFLMRIIA